MLFNHAEKIKNIKDIFKNPPQIDHEIQVDLVLLESARSKVKAQEWNKASLEYLELVHLLSPHIPFYILREWFMCLSKIKYEPLYFGIELGLYLNQHDIDFNPDHFQLLLELLIDKGESVHANQLISKLPSEKRTNSLEILKIKILHSLKDFQNATHLINEILKKNNQPSPKQKLSNFLQNVYMEYAKIYESQGELDKAYQIYQSLLHFNPSQDEIQFELAKFYLNREQEAEAINILDTLVKQYPEKLDYIQTYIECLMNAPHRLKYAYELTKSFLTQLKKEDEILQFKIYVAWIQGQFSIGNKQFNELISEYPNHPYLIQILFEYAQKHGQTAYLLELKEKYHFLIDKQNHSYASNIFSKRNSTYSFQTLIPFHHDRPQTIEFPPEFQSLLQELSTYGDIYLVGGCVLSLLNKQEYDAKVDIDLICVTQQKEIKGFIASPFIENLYKRNTRISHGPSVDLMKVAPQNTLKDILEQNACLRDFTICALFCDRDGTIHDPSGRAIEDFHLQRLDTIIDARISLKEDPVRILRAFKYMRKGYQPSYALDNAIKNLASLELSKNSHFNSVLLKECHSLEYKEFIKFLIEYDFIKHLNYLEITVSNHEPDSIRNQLIQSLYTHQRSLTPTLIARTNNSNHSFKLQMYVQKIKYLQEDLKLQNIFSEKIASQLQQFELGFLSKQELKTRIHQMKFKEQEILRLQQQQHLIQSTKKNKIAELRKRLEEKRQKNQCLLNQNIETEQQIIQEKIKEEYQKFKEDSRLISIKNSSKSEVIIGENDVLMQKIQNVEHQLQTEINIYHQYQQQEQALERRIESFQNKSDQMNTRIQEFKIRRETLLNDASAVPTQFRPIESEIKHLYSLEQMVHIVSKKDLRSYLHAHIFFKELSLPKEKQNIFKIINHIHQFLFFLPEELQTIYHERAQAILNNIQIPHEEKTYKEFLEMAIEAQKMMHIEKAIFYFEKAIQNYATKNRTKNHHGIYFNAYFELAELYFNHGDLMQVDMIYRILKKSTDLPRTIKEKIIKYKSRIQFKLNLITPIQSRDSTLMGYQDFLVCNIHEQLSDKTTFLRKEILFEITQKTNVLEEYLLALIENVYLLDKQYAGFQNEIIRSIEQTNTTVEILLEYAQAQGIPNSLIEKLNDLNSESHHPQSTNYSATNQLLDLPHHIDILKFMNSHTLHPKLYHFTSFYIAQYKLYKNELWEALFHFEESAQIVISTYNIHQKFKDISWESCDDNGWFELGNFYLSHNQMKPAIFCFSHTLRLNPTRLDAAIKLLKLYSQSKEERQIIRLTPIIKKLQQHLSILKDSKRLSTEQEQIFENCTNETNDIFQNLSTNFTKKKELADKVSNTIEIHSLEKFDFSKNKLFTSLIWNVYHNETQLLMTHIIIHHIYKKHEYALAHFELANYLYDNKESIFIYHFLEAVEIWPHLKLIAHEMNEFAHLFTKDLGIIRKNYLLMLYNRYMIEELKHQTSSSIFIEYFQYFINNLAFYLIEPQVIDAFLLLQNLSPLLRFQGLILLGEYKSAYHALQNIHSDNEQNCECIFNWPANLESMMRYIQEIKRFYSGLIQEASSEFQEIAKSYLEKIEIFIESICTEEKSAYELPKP